MKDYWQIYKDLELINDAVPVPEVSRSIVVAHFNNWWRSRTNRKIENLSYEAQLQHLDRCLEVDVTQRRGAHQSTFWRRCWKLLNQPLFEWSSVSSREPEIRQVSDQTGRVWWYAYDPMTGQTTYLASKEDVQVWLEQRFHY